MIKILISDDIEIIMNTLKKIVENIDVAKEIKTAKTYDDIIYMLKHYKPDIIISDIIKNTEARIFKIAKEYNKNIDYSPKFILISGMDKNYIEYNIVKYELNNIIAYISKPFAEEEIKQVLNYYIYNIEKNN